MDDEDWDDDYAAARERNRRIGRTLMVAAGVLLLIALFAAGVRYCENRDPGDPIINIQIG